MVNEPIDRTRLPITGPAFTGQVNRTLAGSVPDWQLIGHVSPPEGAPNVLLILVDDAGFGNPSAFGGPISTPAMNRMAEEGVRYNRFHVTALCSPTRAALLTGRNHHAVGFGSIGESSSGFPGYTAFVPEDSAPFPKVLQMNGYGTAAFGKWHLTPDGQQGAAGPFDRWPNAWGFDYFWGFLGGESGQWDPVITENTETIGVPQAGTASSTTSPMTWRTRQSSGCTRSALRTRPSRGSCLSRPGVLTRRTRCLRSGPTSTAAGSTAAGMRTGKRRSNGRKGWGSSRQTRS